MSKLKMRDVARLAGVSTATVSRVFHSPQLVKLATRKRVERIIEEHQYVYDVNAAEFSRRSTSMLGLIIPTVKSSIHAEVIHGIQTRLKGTGYSLIIGNTDYDTSAEIGLIRLFEQRRLAGIIVTGLKTQSRKALRSAVERGVPVVVIWETTGAKWAHCVGFDNRRAAYEMTSYLARLGHRRIGLIMGPYSTEVRVRQRFQGYRAALEERGLGFVPEQAIERQPTLVDGREAMLTLMATKPRPTAVFAASDVLAMGALAAAKSLGLSVPGDVSIAGFDDIDFASFCDPPLTTVQIPAFEMGQRAAGVLLDRPQSDSAPVQHCSLETSLVVRGSCAPPRRSPPRAR